MVFIHHERFINCAAKVDHDFGSDGLAPFAIRNSTISTCGAPMANVQGVRLDMYLCGTSLMLKFEPRRRRAISRRRLWQNAVLLRVLDGCACATMTAKNLSSYREDWREPNGHRRRQRLSTQSLGRHPIFSSISFRDRVLHSKFLFASRSSPELRTGEQMISGL
jgi:hypothetical protein